MNCQSLYLQSKWKRAQQRMLQNEQADQIKQMSSAKKINSHSHSILAHKLSQKLAPFCDDSILNIETSIPLLHATQLLQAIQSIQAAKKKLQEGQFESSRLKEEARFVYCLWKMIDQEEIETRQLKEIIYMLNDKHPAQLLPSLSEIYPNQEAVSQFVETWKILLQDSQYYRSMEKIEKKKQVSKQTKQIQKIMENDLKELCLNQSKEIKEYFLNSSKHLDRTSKFMPVLSTQLSTKNKQNTQIDRIRQQQIVKRLYQVEKYKIRELQKKAEQQKRQQEMLQSCTFKPTLHNDRLRSASANKRSNSINGYNKAVNRMKVGQEKSRIEKQKKQYKPIGENYQKLRQMKPNPPKFLQRKRQEQPAQFFIEFDLGRHKVKAKIRQSDKQQVIAHNLCKIYSLKQEYFQQICLIIRKEREVYEAQQRI